MLTREDRVLIISPHADDEVIGCGGLLNRCNYLGIKVHVNVFAISSYRSQATGKQVDAEERYEELKRSMGVINSQASFEVIYKGAPAVESYLDTVPQIELVSNLDTWIDNFKPTVIAYPYPSHHQDHRAVHDACVSALRPSPYSRDIKMKLVYEYPYYDAWNPSAIRSGKMYLPMSRSDINLKLAAFNQYKSQVQRTKGDLLHPESIEAFARTRGMECGFEFAEAYYLQGGLIM